MRKHLKFKYNLKSAVLLTAFSVLLGCTSAPEAKTAAEILGNPAYPAIAFGGYRHVERSQAPSLEELKEDVRILHAAGFRILRTYHARLYDHTPKLLQAIAEIRAKDPSFEMYVMLGAWMQCEGAWTDSLNHEKGDEVENTAEIAKAVELAQAYPDIVKVIAVGNESMVHWAASYYVHPRIILKEVTYLQSLKADGKLDSSLWITSSDNFASWGGEGPEYHLAALDSLIAAVDYLSVHVYPFHDTHYNPDWWWIEEAPRDGDDKASILNQAILRGIDRATGQVKSVAAYVKHLNLSKPIHIGETGWASADNHLYGAEGSKAADEFKQYVYYRGITDYCKSNGMACFYFEAFDEPWKDGKNAGGSENHFGLFTVDGQAKMPVWSLVDEGLLTGYSRGGSSVKKTLGGDASKAIALSPYPPLRSAQPMLSISDSLQSVFLLGPNPLSPPNGDSQPLKMNPWEQTCALSFTKPGVLHVKGGTGGWWGASLECAVPLNLDSLQLKYLEIEISSESSAVFELGLQSGNYGDGSQVSAGVLFGPGTENELDARPRLIQIPFETIKAEANLKDVRAPLYIKGIRNFDGKHIRIHRMAYRS